MGVLRNILNSINGMWKELRELKSLQDPTNKVKAESFDKLNGVLSEAQGSIRVQSVSTKIDKAGNEYVEVIYAPIAERIVPNGKGEMISTPRFKALNASDLVPFNDQMRIRDRIDSCSRKERLGE